MAESEIHTTGNSSHEYRGRASVCYEAGTDHPGRIFRVELGDDALSGTVYEMMASSISGFPNVSLVVEDASLENMTVDQYFLAAQQMLDATGMGYTYSDVTDIQIAGQDFRIMETSVAVNDYEVLQKYCTRKQGGKFVSIILSYTTDTTAEADEILAAFTPLNTDTEAAPAE